MWWQENMWWITGFLIVTVICIVVMLMRNSRAKTDTVLRSEHDTVRNSVSLKPKKDTTKLD
ncbi:MAG: hypothetical protein K0Q67_995 [Cellvibrio sp.]|jgi:hypothetical protein|nr:hypothetical protein [Cellvibrio sp.]MDF3011926.1 hypothetical protein [Cellvibrio sp.]